MAKYTPGQKVKHVTGVGPLMVVDHYNGTSPMVNCTWFIGSKLNKGVFHEETLELFVRKVKNDKEED